MAANRQEFDRDLVAVHAQVSRLFAMVADDIPAATRALLSGDEMTWEAVAERDHVIDTAYAEIENLAAQAILLQAPVGPDLRLLLSVLRIVPELERSHDLVTHIAARARQELHPDLTPRSRGLVDRMASLATGMWRQAMAAWNHRDGAAATLLRERDEDLGQLHASLLSELGSGQMSVPVTMEMTLVARFYQRLGDHAVNIACRMPYQLSVIPQQH
jgi:phosphate transport system protein